MLVLTRRVNETIMIGDDIAITIVSVQGHGPHAQVRIGITAPRETTVLRREVFDAIRNDPEGTARPTRLPAAVPAPGIGGGSAQ